MDDWFDENAYNLEKHYLAFEEPWKQSGFSGPRERWEKCRRPIADFITKPGTLLDIGCANGYLLECIMKWKLEDGIHITPYGLDIGERLVKLAKERLTGFACNMFVGNAFDWNPPLKFDYVRTELVYVPEEFRMKFVDRLLRDFLTEDGSLLVCEYRSSKIIIHDPWVDDILRSYDLNVIACKSAVYEGQELTRVALLKNGSKGSF